MKKRLVLMSLVGILVLLLAGCGSSANSGSKKEIRELKEEIKELKEENKKLRKKLGVDNESIFSVVKEQETWDDDYIIPFLDDYIYEAVRDITKITERDITYGDIKYIDELRIADCYNSSSLKYFTGLEKLQIGERGTIGLEELDVSNLHNLTELTIIYALDLETIEGLENLDKLSSVTFEQCDYLDITILSKATELRKLEVYTFRLDYSEYYDLGFLLELEKLEDLHIASSKNIYYDPITGEPYDRVVIGLSNLQEWVDTH